MITKLPGPVILDRSVTKLKLNAPAFGSSDTGRATKATPTRTVGSKKVKK